MPRPVNGRSYALRQSCGWRIWAGKCVLSRNCGKWVVFTYRFSIDSFEKHLVDTLDVSAVPDVFTRKMGFFATHYQGRDCCIGCAMSPGFETYTTGWYSLIVQPID